MKDIIDRLDIGKIIYCMIYVLLVLIGACVGVFLEDLAVEKIQEKAVIEEAVEKSSINPNNVFKYVIHKGGSFSEEYPDQDLDKYVACIEMAKDAGFTTAAVEYDVHTEERGTVANFTAVANNDENKLCNIQYSTSEKLLTITITDFTQEDK